MSKQEGKWKLVDKMPIVDYDCGMHAGNTVRLRKELVLRDHNNRETGKVYPAGSLWKVVNGSNEEPKCVWLRSPNDLLHTWSDDADFWDWFELISA